MKYTVIDVREPYEYEINHVKDSKNIPLGHLANNPDVIAEIPKDTDIIVYCRGGVRAEQAKTILQNLGYENVTNGINKQNVESRFGI